jgi:protein-S-isoprenylcysteine O-methyltransferase Ste14
MALGKFLQGKRVLIARIVWLILILWLFGYQRIATIPLASSEAIPGLMVLLLGILIRALAAGTLVKNSELTTVGLYAIVRNPLYLGSLLLLIGINLIIWHWLVALVSLLLFAITYYPTILREEAGLAHHYGDAWHAYQQSTPRLLPNPLRLGQIGQLPWSGRQWLRNHEHNTLIVAIATLLLLLAYQKWWALPVA